MDIIRPAATAEVPVIMDANPYYSTSAAATRPRRSRRRQDGLHDRLPLFYDNYFVPRGYAIVLLDMVGTNRSTAARRPADARTPERRRRIDWLNGRAGGVREDGNRVAADWHNGRTA